MHRPRVAANAGKISNDEAQTETIKVSLTYEKLLQQMSYEYYEYEVRLQLGDSLYYLGFKCNIREDRHLYSFIIKSLPKHFCKELLNVEPNSSKWLDFDKHNPDVHTDQHNKSIARKGSPRGMPFSIPQGIGLAKRSR